MVQLKNRRIALIGGAGFIGHNLALELKRRGAEVSVIDGLQVNNLLAFASTNVDIVNRELYSKIVNERLDLLARASIPLYVQDARDYHQLSKLLTAIKPQVIVLLAAVAHASRSNKDPYATFDHSLRTLENALDWARAEPVEQFIYFSSSMIYGNFTNGIVTEETTCEPIGIYGALKLAGERILIAYNQVFGLPYTIVRPSALYGERCVSRRVGQVFIENALQGMDVTVKGDGSDRLDFTYVGDLVDGVIKCMENEKAKNQTFNLTYGQGRSISEMVDILKTHFPHVNVLSLERDQFMPERGTLSIEKAKRLIGYNPQYPLDKGFPKYIAWYKGIFDAYAHNSHPTTPPTYE